MAAQVAIQGGGMAALACDHILRRFGFRVNVSSAERSTGPVVLLNDQATHVIRDVLERPDLFVDAPRIRKRIVAWSPGAEPSVIDHSAAIVPLLPTLDRQSEPAVADWTLYAARPFPQQSKAMHFGERPAYVSTVALRKEANAEACWIEGLENGWLFLISDTTGAGWLLSIGQPTGQGLDESSLVCRQIASVVWEAGQFPSHPRILSPLCGPGWLACGSAAVGFDPICGDGTAHALREGILASACIQAIERGEDQTAVLAHYETRVISAMQQHLVRCRDFYQSGHRGPWWDTQISALRVGYQWCAQKLAEQPPYVYSLRGFELVR